MYIANERDILNAMDGINSNVDDNSNKNNFAMNISQIRQASVSRIKKSHLMELL